MTETKRTPCQRPPLGFPWILASILGMTLPSWGAGGNFSADLSFSVERGFYTEPFDVTISVDVPGAEIRYTLDGSDPIHAGWARRVPTPTIVRIDPANTQDRYIAPGVCLRAVAFSGSDQITRVRTHTYLFVDRVVSLSPPNVRPGPQWPHPVRGGSGQWINYGMDPKVCENPRYRNRIVEALVSIPTFSIVTDLPNLFDRTTGIYMNAFGRGLDWERPASLELLHPDGRPGFQIDCGLRIRGGWSRNPFFFKHAFRLFFREIYGDKQLKYPLFGDEGTDEFDKIDLRTDQNYSWANKGEGDDSGRHYTALRDVFSRDSQRDMGMPYTRSRYYHLYLNGVYWGLYQTQERSEAAYAATYFGGKREDYDVIKKDGQRGGLEANDGTLDAWHALWAIARRGFTSNADYYRVLGRNPDGSPNPAYPVLVDPDNLITYMISVYYTGDFDSPISAFASNNMVNNLFAIYNRARPDGFKFFRHDAEHTLFLNEGGIPGAGIDRTGPYRCGENRDQFNPQWLHQQLMNHPAYRLRFADWVYRLFFNGGVFTPEAVIRRLEARRAEIETAIIAESARWGDAMVPEPRTYHKDWLPAVNFLLKTYAPVRTQMVLNQFKAKGWYPDVSPPRFSHTTGVVPRGTAITLSGFDGVAYYTLDGSDPYRAVSTGAPSTHALIPFTATKFVLVPRSDIGSAWRTERSYDVSGWMSVSGAPGGIGYEAGTGFESLIGLDVKDLMYDPDGRNPTANTSCYIRIPFTVSGQRLKRLSRLFCTTQFDDGIVVYLNGTRVLAENAPADPLWNAAALGPIDAEETERTYDLSAYLNRLIAGENLLAIHALNTSRQSSDFLVTFSLTAEETGLSGDVSPAARVYTDAIPIEGHCTLKARAHSAKGWSPLAEIRLWVEEEIRELRITELHYHPLPDEASDDASVYEFIELKNMGITPYDLSGHRFLTGIAYAFPTGTVLEGGAFFVLAADAQAFARRYGFAPDGVYQGKLDNRGERIVLANAAGDTVIDLRYDDRYPWPISADGKGYSLVIKSLLPGVDMNDGRSWTRSAEIHGSPGAEDRMTRVPAPPITPTSAPCHLDLSPNHPNPFNGTTTFRFRMDRPSRVNLVVYDLLGRVVDQKDLGFCLAGEHRILWDAQGLPSGVYLVRVEAAGRSASRKCLLVK